MSCAPASSLGRREFCAAAGSALALPARADSLDDLDAHDLARLIRRGDVSPQDLLERAIARAEALQGRLGAMSVRDYDRAREQVRHRPRGRNAARAPFEGLPFLLKDLWVAYAGTECTNGSRAFAGARSDYDGELVRRFLRAGFVIFGKTASPEFGLTPSTESALHGATKNPWDIRRTAGGSSGGAAAAVAAGIVPIAHASDGGGSIRIPASCCGVFGLKPSRGRVPFPVDRLEGWAGLSAHFAISRSVRDSAALLDLVAGPAFGSSGLAVPKTQEFSAALRRPPRGLRIAVLRESLAGSALSDEARVALDDAVRLCTELGHCVRAAAPAVDQAAYAAAFGAVVAVHTALALDDRARVTGRAITRDDVEPVTWMISEAGRKVDAMTLQRARDTFDRVAVQMATFFNDFDVLMTPTVAKPPVPLGILSLSPSDFQSFAREATEFAPSTSLANVSGQPAMSVPLHWSAAGLPVGIMFQSRFGAEALLFALAAQLERARPWAARRPGLI